jgi:hypothetical protein
MAVLVTSGPGTLQFDREYFTVLRNARGKIALSDSVHLSARGIYAVKFVRTTKLMGKR